MNKKTGFFIDPDDFLKDFTKIVDTAIPELAGKGLFAAGKSLIHDAINLPPQAPFLKGDLRGSRIVEKAKKSRKDVSTKAGFNINYAARQHEAEPGEFNYTRTGAKNPGPKFLESKMVSKKDKYMHIVAETIKAGGKSW